MKNNTYEYFLSKIEKLEQYIEAYEFEAEKCNSLKKEIGNCNKLGKDLYEKYHKKYGMISTMENKRYSMEELDQIRAELADTSLLTVLKRFFGIGKRNDEIYADLMGKIHGLAMYLNEELDYYSERLEKEAIRLEENSSVYETNYKQIQRASGCGLDTDWGRYSQVEQVAGDLYLCDIDVSLEVKIQYAEELLKKTMPASYCAGIVRVPYTRSLSEPVHLLYEYKKEYNTQVVQSVKSLVYQMIRMTPAYYLEMHLMDGENTGADFAELINLQKVREGDLIQLNRKVTGGRYRMAQVYLEDTAITAALKNLNQYMTLVAEEMGAFHSLDAYNESNHDIKTGKGLIPYQIIIIQNFPTGFTDEDINLLDKLIRNGQKRGIWIIILNSLDRWTEILQRNSYNSGKAKSIQEKLSREAIVSLDTIHLDQDVARIAAADCASTCRLQLMLEGKETYIDHVIKVKTAVQETDNYFPHIFGEEFLYGQMDSRRGLKIPFAIDRKGNIIEYCLGEAMNAHGLISGGTGSGKSTLLHMLISSIVMNYSPDDVEIWLADYKITEFYSYKSNTPPHIRFIGLSKTADFSYAFIDKITNEMNRRQSVIAEADFQLKSSGEKVNITNFNEYRKIFGIASMRRLIIIIDEFHVMAQFAQKEPDYKEKLENLLAEARALGIIILFSDQAIADGLRGLSEKARKQIKARIAMANSKDELEETLDEKEPEKIKPFLTMKTGEIAIQTVKEERDEDGILKEMMQIERGLVIYIDGEWRFKVNDRVRKLYHAENYVSDSFDDRIVEEVDWKKISEWEQKFLKPHKNGKKDMHVYLGRPVNLELNMHFPLLQRKSNNIMCVSGTEEQQMQIFQAVTGSFQRQENSEIVVITDSYASVYHEYGEDIQSMAAEYENMLVYEELEDICYQVNRILGIMNDRSNQKKVLVVWLGLDIIADLLKEESSRKSVELLRIAEGEGNRRKSSANREKSLEKADSQDEIDLLFGSLFDDEDDLDEDPYAEEENFSKMGTEEYLYNACDDITRIIHLGPTRNVFNLVIYDSAAALKDFRGVKITDFNHRVAFAMSENEASDFLERGGLIRQLPENMAFYYNGRTGYRFIPYKL